VQASGVSSDTLITERCRCPIDYKEPLTIAALDGVDRALAHRNRRVPSYYCLPRFRSLRRWDPSWVRCCTPCGRASNILGQRKVPLAAKARTHHHDRSRRQRNGKQECLGLPVKTSARFPSRSAAQSPDDGENRFNGFAPFGSVCRSRTWPVKWWKQGSWSEFHRY